MNIGIVTTWLERGASYVSRQYMKSLEKENNIFIYARGGEHYVKGNNIWDNENVTWGKLLPPGIHGSIELNDFKKWIERNKIEIVFFNEEHFFQPILLCNELNVKCGAYVDYYKKNTVECFGVYDFLICNTERHYSVFKWHPQCYYVPWGTDTELFKPKVIKRTLEDKLVFFHSAGYSPDRKGTGILIKAFEMVDKKKAKLFIHSQVKLEDFFPELAETIRRLVKDESIVIREETVSAPGLYHLGDVYVYPTLLEGIGLTIAEALASGLPVITGDNPPMNEFVNNECGKLVEIYSFAMREDNYYWPQSFCSIDSLLEKMNWYIDNYYRIEELKLAARKHAESMLCWKKNSSVLLEIFNTIKRIDSADKNEALAKAKEHDLKEFSIDSKKYYESNLKYRLYRASLIVEHAFSITIRGFRRLFKLIFRER